jgi:ABC-2 type transport system permease protein
MSSQTLPESNPARPVETAPSAVAAEEPGWARTVGLMGMMLTVLGLTVVTFNEIYGPRIIGKGWGFVFVALGVLSMLFHAVRDDDYQIRRAYGAIGYGLLALMVLLTLIRGANFLAYGWACAIGALCFLLCFGKHETDPLWRRRILLTLGGVGAALAGTGFVVGLLIDQFLLSYGVILTVLGLAYICAFISQSDPLSEAGHRAAVGLGMTAVFVILYAVLRSVVPAIVTVNATPFFVPRGLVLLFLGALYGAFSLAVITDNRLVVLTRRELAGYFYSPVAYIVMLGLALLGALAYFLFVGSVYRGDIRYEPIVVYYFGGLPPFVVMFVVPAITMRLIAEEKRTGTYEVLMCAPVKETTVVLSKFFACLIFFVLIWAVWALYLIALQSASDQELDYRPLLSFYLALSLSGAAFIAMGLFFSALNRNQIVAAVLTFVAMLVVYAAGVLLVNNDSVAPIWRAAFRHISYAELWNESLRGRLHVRDMILQASFAFFWLYLTVKVLEARRWT